MAEVTITPKSAARAAKAIKDELAKREQQLTWEENLEKRLEEIKALLDSEDGRKGRVDAGIYFKSVAFSAHCTELGMDLLAGDRKVFFNVRKVIPHINKKYGVLDGFKISGYESIEKWTQIQSFSSDRVISLSEKSNLILQKIFDEAYIYLTGDRAQRNLFLEEDDQEEEQEEGET